MRTLHILLVFLLIAIISIPLIAQDTTTTQTPMFTMKPFEPFLDPRNSCYAEDLIFQEAKATYDEAKEKLKRAEEAFRRAKVSIWGTIGAMFANTPSDEVPETLDEALEQIESSINAQNSNARLWRITMNEFETAEENHKKAEKEYKRVKPIYDSAHQAYKDCVNPLTAPCSHLVPGHPTVRFVKSPFNCGHQDYSCQWRSHERKHCPDRIILIEGIGATTIIQPCTLGPFYYKCIPHIHSYPLPPYPYNNSYNYYTGQAYRQ